MVNDTYIQFIEKMRSEKSPEDFEQFMHALVQFGATEIFLLAVSQLTEEDLTGIEQISDELKAQEEIHRLFKLRTGISIKEFIEHIKTALAANYQVSSHTEK